MKQVLINFDSVKQASDFMLWMESTYLDNEIDDIDFERNTININKYINESKSENCL